MFIHNKERKLCDICGKDFSNDINVSAHKRNFHLNPYTFLARYKGVDINCDRCKQIIKLVEEHMTEHV